MTFRALICALLALAGCHRSPGPPDPNYEEASRIYQQLYTQKLDDAYGDPRIDEVVALLRKVDRRSIDALAAEALLATVEDGRARFAKARTASEAAQKAAQLAGAGPSIDPSSILAAGRDAGPPADLYGPGASITEINASSGGCLVAGEPFHENVTNVAGTVYRLSGSSACADRLAGFAGQVTLVVDGKVYRRLPESMVVKPPPPPAPPPAPAPAPRAAPPTQAAAEPGAETN
jgi:hypothetical protein